MYIYTYIQDYTFSYCLFKDLHIVNHIHTVVSCTQTVGLMVVVTGGNIFHLSSLLNKLNNAGKKRKYSYAISNTKISATLSELRCLLFIQSPCKMKLT